MDLIEQLIRKYQTRTLEILEKKVWNEEDYDFSFLTRTCYRLRKKPLGYFQVEDLRVMIGQQIGLEYLIPFAIQELQVDILAEGDFYPGDLLKNVLNIGEDFWSENEDFRSIVRGLISKNRETLLREGIDFSKFK